MNDVTTAYEAGDYKIMRDMNPWRPKWYAHGRDFSGRFCRLAEYRDEGSAIRSVRAMSGAEPRKV